MKLLNLKLLKSRVFMVSLKENEYCKIFDLEDFGYHKITVERPLQLNFMISPERIENLYNEATFAKLYDEEAYTELSRKKTRSQQI